MAGLLVAQPTLRIVSPAEGSTFHPGESVTVDVEASPPEAFKLVYVVGFDPIGFSKEKVDRPPYRFSVRIPDRIRPDKYGLTAFGSTQAGQLVTSNPVLILVERADSPVSVSVYPVVVDFTMDQKRYLEVTGHYADGTTADLTQSSRIRYVSSAPSVATVQAQGIVTPVAPGSAKITISYGDLKAEVPVRVRAR